MSQRSSFTINVDDDDDIDNSKPAAIEPNVVHLVGDGTVNSTPATTLPNVVTVTVTQSPHDNCDVRDRSPGLPHHFSDAITKRSVPNQMIH